MALFTKSRFFIIFKGQNQFTAIDKPRINNQITARELRVIDEKGENLGVMSLSDALKLANPESGLDLIEIAPLAVPPVARVMSFDKYRYEKEKADKKERKANRATDTKRVQISARAAGNDLHVKAKQADKFLEEGHQVEIYVRLKGREKYNRDWANQKLTEFLKMVTIEYKIISAPKAGQGLSMQIVKK